MDEFRLTEMRWSIRRTTLIASVVLVTLNTVGQQLASDAAYLTSLKKVLHILLDGVSEGWVRTCLEFIWPEYPHAPILCSIDLVAVLEAILTSRQPHEKLQCFYENLMLNTFRKTAVLKKNMNYKLRGRSECVTNKPHRTSAGRLSD